MVAFIRTYVTYVELFGKVKSNRKRGSPPVRFGTCRRQFAIANWCLWAVRPGGGNYYKVPL